jgi:hypothetical protein
MVLEGAFLVVKREFSHENFYNRCFQEILFYLNISLFAAINKKYCQWLWMASFINWFGHSIRPTRVVIYYSVSHNTAYTGTRRPREPDRISTWRGDFIERQPRNKIKKQTNLLQNRQKMTAPRRGGEGHWTWNAAPPPTSTGEFQRARFSLILRYYISPLHIMPQYVHFIYVCFIFLQHAAKSKSYIPFATKHLV